LGSVEGGSGLAAWEQWRSAAVPPTVLADLKRPKDFEEFTKNLRPEDVDIDRGWI
jgi:hypothetical protein